MRQFTISKLLIAFLMLLCCGTAMASDFVTVDGFKFLVDTDKNEATLLPNDYSGEVVIPEHVAFEMMDYPVTTLGANCFGSTVTSVCIPNTVKILGAKSFYGSGVKSIEIPNSVVSLEKECFAESSLCGIQLPNSVISLGYKCFYNSALKEIDLPTSVTKLGEYCFYNCRLENVILPKSIAEIPYGCFCYCNSLKEVVVPSSVRVVEGNAFGWCSSLENITFSEGLEFIRESCFQGCTSLKKIEFPSTFINGNNWSFDGCYNLKEIVCKAPNPPYMTWGNNVPFLECVVYVPQSSIELYKQSGYWNCFGIIKEIEGESEEAKSCSTPVISYISGNLSFESSTPGAEYHYTINDADVATDKYNTDGKVLLNGKLDISVYATADGYKASDKATATLYWLNAEGGDDTNNINLVKTRGVMVTTDSDITISGLNDGEVVTFYSVNGVNLGSAKAVQGVLHFAKPNESIVIAKIKGNDLKIAIK